MVAGSFAMFIGVCIINALAASGDINNLETGDISDWYASPFTPDGWAFSIWGLIYCTLAAYHIFSLFPAGRKHAFVRTISPILALNYAFNISWILVWQYIQIEASLFFMILILVTLICIYRFGKISYHVDRCAAATSTSCSAQNKTSSPVDDVPAVEKPKKCWLTRVRDTLIQVPFSLYLGWISVATIANVFIVIVKNSNPETRVHGVYWSCGMQTVAALLAIKFLYRFGDIIYPSVVVWALWAISTKHHMVPETFAVSRCLAGLLIVLIIVTFLHHVATLFCTHLSHRFAWAHCVESGHCQSDACCHGADEKTALTAHSGHGHGHEHRRRSPHRPSSSHRRERRA